ncbi:MAG: rhodanese-like domain-containing protein [Hydrococcus sp. RU_2_2]|nr:rhodanese-like domain-containing protein [Hydrococcus sp. RU_2_2]NJP19640.1 rhodanese-like domain-containing protein [Hydrococcus sp. CRU_1_1]
MFLCKKLVWIAIKFLIRVKFSKVPKISTSDLAAWLERAVDRPVLLDARTPEEYAIGHLWGAKLVPASLEELKLDLSVPIVVYCSIGYRSAIVVKRLQAMGYKKIFNLEGSIFQWANERRPLNRKGDRIHPHNQFWGLLLDL